MFGVISILIMLLITTPSRDKFDDWISQEYTITCEFDVELLNICYKDGERILSRSSHFTNAAIFATYQINYKLESGERISLRTLGVLGTLFKMNEGFIWELFN